MSKTILVIAPHPDDEVLGAGGTIARRAAEGHSVHVLTVTRGMPPLYPAELVERTRLEAEKAHKVLGVHAAHWLDLPAAELDTLPHRAVNDLVEKAVSAVAPDELFLPFVGDVHLDHQLVFVAGLVAARPHGKRYPTSVYAYETLSETNWNAPYLTPGFQPNHFVDISGYLDQKVNALACFASQLRPAPHERSVEAARALAVLRGATIGVAAAEAFVTVRTVSK